MTSPHDKAIEAVAAKLRSPAAFPGNTATLVARELISAYLASIGGIVCARDPVAIGIQRWGEIVGFIPGGDINAEYRLPEDDLPRVPLHAPIPEAGNGDGWNRDMDAAPKDKPIWLGHECGLMEPAHFNPAAHGFWYNLYTGLPIGWNPRFWQRIPPPPSIRSSDAGREG